MWEFKEIKSVGVTKISEPELCEDKYTALLLCFSPSLPCNTLTEKYELRETEQQL